MENILCFGDSNTFGWDPDGLTRFDEKTRWAGVLAGLLGREYRVLEEGLGGRTTVFPDMASEGRCGRDYLVPCVQSHQPLDLVILMLGTNDMKRTFSPTSLEIGRGMESLVQILKTPYIWDSLVPPRVLVVSPVRLGENLGETPFAEMFDGNRGIAISRELPGVYRQLAEKYECDFMDAGQAAQPSLTDAVHMNAENHRKLAKAFFEKIQQMKL